MIDPDERTAPEGRRPAGSCSWTPPPRPEWVQRLNEEGAWMNIEGVVPLDASSLIDAAKRATGLSDFGDDEWVEPFHVLLQSYERDAALNLMGRLRTRSELLQLLEARLQIEHWYRLHPEIEEEEIVQPFIVLGQGRSGTSFLVNLLGANPDNGVISHAESIFPCPPPEAGTIDADPRMERGDKLITQWIRVTPTLASMHEFSGYLPAECNHPMAISFLSPHWFSALGQCETYNRYCAERSLEPGYRYYKRILKLLQWRNPRKHWALKAVTHLDALDMVIKTFPDACLIWPHRDPVRAFASGSSIVNTFNWGRSDQPMKAGSYDFATNPEAAAARLNRGIDLIEAGIVPKEQLFNLLYTDFVGNPMAAIGAIYRHFNIPLTAAGLTAMENYLRNNPRDDRPPHRMKLPDGADIQRMRRAFARYQDYFGVPDE